MRRSDLQEIATALAKMAVSARLMPDYEVLSDLPDGTVNVDLLDGSSVHSSGLPCTLGIAGELREWLSGRILRVHGDMQNISIAQIEVHYRTDRVPTNRRTIVSFDFVGTSVLIAMGQKYTGEPVAKHVLHNRVAA